MTAPAITASGRRLGTTLVELLVALLLLGVGATALAGGLRSASRSAAYGRVVSLGAHAAESRLEQLRSRCAAGGGSTSSGSVTEHWSIGPRAGPLLPSVEVQDSLILLRSGGASARLVWSIARCVP